MTHFNQTFAFVNNDHLLSVLRSQDSNEDFPTQLHRLIQQ